MNEAVYDIVVFGATGFVGQILTRYLIEQYGVDRDLRWAIAGRSEAKLTALKQRHHVATLPHHVVDASDGVALKALCEATRVVVSSVGPYALYGEPLVQACVATGTDYCDLTGEIQWAHQMIERYQDHAQGSGARLVNCCGFDSIPSDLGVYFLQAQAFDQFGRYCNQIRMRTHTLHGTASGGTYASMINLVTQARADAQLRAALQDPYWLCPTNHQYQTDQQDLHSATYDAQFDEWIAPFIMAIVNSRVVFRSNALARYPYGTDFQYSEAMLMGKGLRGRVRAVSMSTFLQAFVLAAAWQPSRWGLGKVLPKPGEGPSEAAQLRGHYDLRFMGATANGAQLTVKVCGDRDPGYGSTAKMLGEAAVCLATQIDKTAKPGGFWTPATIFGDFLIQRLCARAGLSFELIS